MAISIVFFFTNFVFRFLSADELKPVLDNIHPSERFYAKQQADHMMSQVKKFDIKCCMQIFKSEFKKLIV